MELENKKKNRFGNIVAKEMGHLEWNEGKIGAGNDYIQRTVQNAVIGHKRYFSSPLETIGQKTHKYESMVPAVGKRRQFDALRNKLKPREWEQDADAWYDGKIDGVYKQVFQNNRTYEKEGWPDLVVCMWSGINRLENLRYSAITKDWSWVVSAWGQFTLEKDNWKAGLDSTVYIDKQYEPGESDYYRGYVMRIRNANYNLRLTIGNMMAVKYMLKAKGIPQLHYLFSSGQYKPLLPLLDYKTYENTNNWWDSMDLNRQQCVDELPFLESEGFYDMAQRNKCRFGVKDHPLEKAHALMAERIIGDIKKNEFLK